MPRYDAERDLRILQAMAGQLEPYLIAEELFWPLDGQVRGGMPRLTVGGLLLRQHRLRALRETLVPHQQEQLDGVLADVAAVRAAWAMHYDGKIAREWEMRQHLLEEFLRDCQDRDGRDCADYWPSQAQERTILHHLYQEAEARRILTDDQRRTLRRIDADLRQYLLPGEVSRFLWSPELEAVYPRDPYWWLWVVPEEQDAETG